MTVDWTALNVAGFVFLAMKEWYYIITQSMLELGLRGTELAVFAILNGFSQGGNGCYYGTRRTLAERCGVTSLMTVDKALHTLIEKGMIERLNITISGEEKIGYAVCPKFVQDIQKIVTPIQNLDIPYTKNIQGEYTKNVYNKNKDIENKDNNFNFQDALIAAGVRKDVVEAWLQVRKAKRAVNTELALKSILREIEKTGRTANECIEIAVEQSWRGFKSDWIDKAANVTAKQMTHDAFLKSTL